MNHVISAATMYPFCGLGLTFTGGGGWGLPLDSKPVKLVPRNRNRPIR